MEPAGGVERSICRRLFGRSNVELHRLNIFIVPFGSKIDRRSEGTFRKDALNATV